MNKQKKNIEIGLKSKWHIPEISEKNSGFFQEFQDIQEFQENSGQFIEFQELSGISGEWDPCCFITLKHYFKRHTIKQWTGKIT